MTNNHSKGVEKYFVRRKFFQILTEKDEGYAISAICFYQRIPWMYQTVYLNEETARKKGFQIENVVTQYKYRFCLDLWLFTMQFQWLSKLNEDLSS